MCLEPATFSLEGRTSRAPVTLGTRDTMAASWRFGVIAGGSFGDRLEFRLA
jgi:hypothetical protein